MNNNNKTSIKTIRARRINERQSQDSEKGFGFLTVKNNVEMDSQVTKLVFERFFRRRIYIATELLIANNIIVFYVSSKFPFIVFNNIQNYH